MHLSGKKILVLAPHPDDGEFGCGATIDKYVKAGAEVWYIAFSPCCKSIPQGFDQYALFQELDVAARVLGISADRVIKMEFEVREFSSHRQEILEELIVLRNKLRPDIVLLPNSYDVHQDHQVIHHEGIRAFKHATLLGYDLPWNYTHTNLNFLTSVSKENLKNKLQAIAAYKSQGFRPYADEEFIHGLARVRGVQAGITYAEGFEMIKMINV